MKTGPSVMQCSDMPGSKTHSDACGQQATMQHNATLVTYYFRKLLCHSCIVVYVVISN